MCMMLAAGCRSSTTTNSITSNIPTETVPWAKVLEDIEVLKALNHDLKVTKFGVTGSIEKDQVNNCRVTLSGNGKKKRYMIDHNGVTEL